MGNVNLDTAHMIAIYLSQKLCLYLYRFWDIVNYLSKLQIFLTPHLFDTPITDNPTGISTRSSAGEHYGSNVCTKICLVILTEQWLRTNTQTHRRTSIACLASCCKNYSKVLILPQSSAILLWLWYCMSLPHSSCHIISFYYWPAYTPWKGATTSNGRWCLSSSFVVVCNTPRRTCRRLHPRRPGDDVMPPPV